MCYDTASEMPKTRNGRLERIDIRKEIEQEILHCDVVIDDMKERKRIAEEKIKLFNKNKELEAYLNLDRR